jgi:hypothetical protein
MLQIMAEVEAVAHNLQMLAELHLKVAMELGV